jgi:hypothetical protein
MHFSHVMIVIPLCFQPSGAVPSGTIDTLSRLWRTSRRSLENSCDGFPIGPGAGAQVQGATLKACRPLYRRVFYPRTVCGVEPLLADLRSEIGFSATSRNPERG